MIEHEGQWTFLTNYAHVLVCLAMNPRSRLREVADLVGITERSAMRLIAQLDEAGIIQRERRGRRNIYTINVDAPLRHPIEEHRSVGSLLGLFLTPAQLRAVQTPGKK